MLHAHNLLIRPHSSTDPTKTVVLRTRFEREIVRRFKVFKKEVVFQLRHRNALQVNAPADKLDAFMQWIKQKEREGILETYWMRTYLLSAYQKGFGRAAHTLEGAGATVSDHYLQFGFHRPIHRDRIGLIYQRSYSDLKGITAAMDTQLSRVLAQGLLEGRSADELAQMVDSGVDDIGIMRARLLARTEVIRAYADGSLATYRDARVEGVQIQSEFATAGDDHVCVLCEALEGQVYSLDDAEGVIPVHPNCRCAWLPVIGDATGVSL